MTRLFLNLFSQLDALYRGQPYFVGVKARLLAVFNLLLILFVPANIIKVLIVQPPGVPTRIGLNFVVGVAALLSIHTLRRGRVESSGNWLALVLIVPAHVVVFLVGTYAEPLSVAFQLFVYDLAFLLLAIVFASRIVALFLFGIIVGSHLAFYSFVLDRRPLAGSMEFAADTFLRDGLMTMAFVFSVGITLVYMIQTAHLRSEEALVETRAMNANLERLVSERTSELENATRLATAASRAKSEFLANMSHEIRTPLNGIIATADLMMRQGELPADTAEQVRLISESGDHLLILLSDILDFSKIEAGQLELERHSFELLPIVADIVAMTEGKAASGSVRLDFNLASALPRHLEGDSHRLRQVLQNLVSNAVKFTPPGGHARVSVSSESPRSNPVPIRFEVRDSGIGMDAAALSRVFERFTQADSSTTRRYGGSGLGLAISSRIVALMGGKLVAESSPGQGSTFHFTVFLRPAQSVPTASAPAGSEASLGLQVLVVEDNPMNRRIIAAQLAQIGCTSSVAGDGEAALAALQGAPAPDVILMDCHMPKLDGWETTRRIRSWGKDPLASRRAAAGIPIIALTAAALPEERARCIEAGMNAFLSKPLKLAELSAALQEATQESESKSA